jgi:hypothetical protein
MGQGYPHPCGISCCSDIAGCRTKSSVTPTRHCQTFAPGCARWSSRKIWHGCPLVPMCLSCRPCSTCNARHHHLGKHAQPHHQVVVAMAVMQPPEAPLTGNGNPTPVRVMIRNPARRREFTDNSPLVRNMRTRRVAKPLALDGGPSLAAHLRWYTMGSLSSCVPWHCKGICFEDCDRDHSTSSDSEAEEFVRWCQAAYA